MMKQNLTLLSLVCLFLNFFLVSSIYVSPAAPYKQGSLTVKTFNIAASKANGLPHSLHVITPTSAANYAVGVFLGGLEGNIPAIAYGEVLAWAASHGVVIIGIEGFPSNPSSTDKLAQNVVVVLNWLTRNLNAELQKRFAGVGAAVQTNLALIGHSAGCKIMVKVLEENCGIAKGLALLNPVDGDDPWGIIKSFVITPGQMLNFTTPTLILGTGLGPIPGIHVGKIFPACAPAGLNFPRFYNASNCGKWSLNATLYGHADLLDPFWYEALKLTHFCATNTQDLANYRQFVGGALAAFSIGVLQGSCDSLQFIEKPELIPAQVDVQVDLSCGNCPKPVCTHQ
eukprot:TRINITY_DN591_c0_g1_i1.p1 TRINITY_DN591_c0_g1~~TRINITY_DN591_c0_g1_i1.p1  ORF type:complete len:353 (+),score=126.86 TRINITY_DN591_c0_g1_i1:38-1060(+)